jgi:CheY-like chemotaxis protein
LRSLEAMWEWNCPKYELLPQLNGQYCSFGHSWTTAKTKAMLWGDSHAEHLAPLVQIAAQPEEGLLLYTNCPAALGGHVTRHFPEVPNYEEYCADQRRRAIQLLEQDASIDLVILSSSWSYLPNLVSQDGQLGEMDGIELLASGIEDLIKRTSVPGRRFVLVGSVPQQKIDPVPCAVIDLSGLLRRPCAVDRENVEFMRTFTIATDKMIQNIARRNTNVTALIPREALCDASGCKTNLDGEFLYRDVCHIRRNLNPETLRDLANLIGLPSALRNQIGLAGPD